MNPILKPTAGLLCLVALGAAGCSAGSGDGSSDAAPATPERSATAAPSETTTAYAPYVSATTAYDTDSAGSPAAYNLAFVISDGSGCTPRWNGTHDVDDASVASRISALTESGAAVRVSFGGASGKELAATCESAAELAEAYGAALDAAGSDLADFDIEGDELTDPASVALRSRAIALLQEERPGLEVSFTLPVMPSGLDSAALALLKSANKYDVQVSTVNLMTMNYGESYDGDMGGYAVTSATAAHLQLKEIFGTSDAAAWKGMALTSMIGENDIEGETFTLDDAARVRSFGEAKGIAWVSMWATFRDRSCAGDDSASECSGVDQRDGAFGEAFSG